MTATYQKWVSIAYVGLSIVAYLLFQQIAELVWDLARFPYPDGLGLTPPEMIGFVAAGVTFFVLRRSARLNEFANEAAGELAKVTWPPRKETVLSTGVIVVVVGLCALCLTAFDVVWGWAVKMIY